MGPVDSSNLYAGFGNDPVNNSDPAGLFFTPETVWDLASLGLGGYQISQWDENTPFAAKVLDVGGVVVDFAAVVVPVLPGGVGAAIKAYRAGDAMHDAYTLGRSVDRGLDAVQGIDQALNVGQAGIYMGEDVRTGTVGWGTGLNALQFGIGFRSLSTRGIGGYRLDFSGGHATANMGAFPRVVRTSPRGFEELPLMDTDSVKRALDAPNGKSRKWAYSEHDHHIYPKWLGGLESGPVMRIRGYEHISDLEPKLEKFMQAQLPAIKTFTASHIQGLIRRRVFTQDDVTDVLRQFYRMRYPQLSDEVIRQTLAGGLGR